MKPKVNLLQGNRKIGYIEFTMHFPYKREDFLGASLFQQNIMGSAPKP